MTRVRHLPQSLYSPRPVLHRVIGPHRIAVGDVQMGAVADVMAADKAAVVYSDPPWGEGNLRYWRTAMGDSLRPRWEDFRGQWCAAVASAITSESAVFVEMGERWADDFAAALAAVRIFVAQRWTVQYGHPPRPNVLLYAGPSLPGGFDPSALNGPALPRACVAAVAHRGEIVLDPCCGKGFTARAAVLNGMRFRGVELNPKRLEVTERWLRSHTT